MGHNSGAFSTRAATTAPAPLPGNIVELNGVEYFVSDQGNGPKTVLLHGIRDTSVLWTLGEAQMTASERFVSAERPYQRLGYGSHWTQLDHSQNMIRHLFTWLQKG